MKIYDAVLFWLGGVLAPALPELTMAELRPGLKGHAFVHTRQQLRALAEEVALGKMSALDYCEGALATCQATSTASALEQKLIAAASLRQPLAKMISEIPNRYECWLVVDYPQAWYPQLADHAQIDALFPSNRLIFTGQLEMLRLVPDVFYRLPQKAARPMQDCIIIDGDAGRAVQSLQHGLASIFYIYLDRLKMELALQEIWQTDADVMHPTSSERVKFR
jgi:hypothetical protein